MSMQVAKKGSRTSQIKVRISEASRAISLSAGFIRKHNLDDKNSRYVRIGYDTTTLDIGLEFLSSPDKNNEALQVTWVKNTAVASFPVGAILTVFNLDISKVTGNYFEDAIEGLTAIPGFAEKGFLLKTSNRELLTVKGD